MQYVACPERDTAFYLALEEYLLEGTGAYFFFWRSNPCVVIGRYQNAFLEVNVRYAEQHGIPVFRRSSGGGAVYHDPGNLNFSWIVPCTDRLPRYDAFLEPMAAALASLGLPVQRRHTSDLFLPEGKFSGNAQSVRRGRVLHHGTLLFEADLSALGRLLFLPNGAGASKAVRSNRSPVANLRNRLPSLDIDAFAAALRQALFPRGLPTYTLTPQDLSAICARANERYARWEWNWALSPALRLTLPGGELAVEEGRIAHVDSPLLPAQAREALTGLPYCYSLLRQTLQTIPALSQKSPQELDKLAGAFFAGEA